jgi:flagellar hook assembly protein FlgD
MSCTVGDEVIYLNDDREDGATPKVIGARKQRFDFTHTTKIKPKTRQGSGEDSQQADNAEAPGIVDLYGEYSQQQLDIKLDRLSDAYQVRITNESGKAVYEKIINAGSIVGLNIDISTYPNGHYTVTVENSNESFTGEFNAQKTGIQEVRMKKEDSKSYIYNLQGQRISSLQKGLNIVNGRKVLVK